MLFLILTLDFDQFIFLILQELNRSLNFVLTIVIALIFIISILVRSFVIICSRCEFFDVGVILSDLYAVILDQLHLYLLCTPQDASLLFFDLRTGGL